VRISRYGQTPPMPAMPYPPQAYNLAAPAPATAPAAEAAPPGKPAPDGKLIRSPMVGTFYNAPAPDVAMATPGSTLPLPFVQSAKTPAAPPKRAMSTS